MSADWRTTTRYHSFARYVRETFGVAVRKLVVDGGFDCPNRDGSLSRGGCTFCAPPSFSPVAADRQPLRDQVLGAVAAARDRGFTGKFLVYFQPFTNTHAPLSVLRSRYDEALCQEDVLGLAVGTRPDCVPEEVLELLAAYAKRRVVWLELGLQSAHDATLARVNRGHDWRCFAEAVARAHAHGLPVCAHLIVGLPGETATEVRLTAERVASLPVEGVKLRQLEIVRGTALEAEFRRGQVTPLTCAEYARLVADVLERLPEAVVIQRLVGETRGDYLVAPRWRETKTQALAAIVAELAARGTWQGVRAHSERPTRS